MGMDSLRLRTACKDVNRNLKVADKLPASNFWGAALRYETLMALDRVARRRGFNTHNYGNYAEAE